MIAAVSDHASVSHSVAEHATQSVEPLGGDIPYLHSAIDLLNRRLSVTTVNKNFRMEFFGGLSCELIFADARPNIPSAVTTISPSTGRDTQVAEVHGKSSYLGAAIAGPRLGSSQVGGRIVTYFYGENILEDRTGLFFAQGYGELKNEGWRFALGLDNDVINPLAPTTLNWIPGSGAGNIG
jgi:hypothetical protein